jgi:hypothetical protein
MEQHLATSREGWSAELVIQNSKNIQDEDTQLSAFNIAKFKTNKQKT